MRRAVWFVALALFAQDPAGTLEKARENLLPRLTRLPKITCVETIDRRYLLREDQVGSAPACETISLNRKKGRNPPKAALWDRLRVAVSMVDGREIYSWTGTEPVSYSVEDIIHPGPIGTGAFAGHLLDVLTNPAVQFRVLDEGPETLEYGFRVPVEASHYTVRGGDTWVATGYSGSFRIPGGGQSVDRFTVTTNELPRETPLCETTSVLEYGDDARWFVPKTTRSHDVMRDASETDSVTAISDCHESTGIAPPLQATTGTPLPVGILLTLNFRTPFDSDVNAAGDPISATITDARLEGSKDATFPRLLGAIVRGRITRVERRNTIFQFSVAFETVDVKGLVSPFYATLLHVPPFAMAPVRGKSTLPPAVGHGRKDWTATFLFDSKASHFVFPAPFEAKWLTTAAGAN